MTQYAKAMDEIILEPDPHGINCFTNQEMNGLVKYRNRCETCFLDLRDTKNTLNECHEKLACNVSWWQEKPVVLTIVATALILGVAGGLAVGSK